MTAGVNMPRPAGSRRYPLHPLLCGPGLSLDELEARLPGTIARQQEFDRFMCDARAFGHFVILRSALPEDLR